MAKKPPKKPDNKKPTPTADKKITTETPAPKAETPTPEKPPAPVIPINAGAQKPPEQGKPPKGAEPPTPTPAKEGQTEKPPQNKVEDSKQPETPPADEKPPQGKTPPKVKPPDAPAKDAAPPESTDKERREKLEKDLREKYGIPKSDKPVEPFVIPETEETIRIPHEQLHSFKGHTFNVNKDAKFMALAASIRGHGVTQPAIVRPREGGGYEIVSGHRRDAASIEAGVPYTPCIIRALNDEQAIQQMVEDNLTTREDRKSVV